MTSRYIPNPFPDYDGQNYLSQDNPDCLREDCSKFITKNLERLFPYWEKNIDRNYTTDKSVYTGLSGAAILYLKAFQSNLFFDVTYLNKCSLITQNYNFDNNNVPTFLCGEIGKLVVIALTREKLGKNYNSYLNKIASAQSLICDTNVPNEILYGRAGYLYSLLFIRSQIENSSNIITDNLIRSVITSILNSGIEASKCSTIESPLVYFWNNEPYVGAAHGYAGIVYLLLESKNFLTLEELNNLVKPTIDFICSLKFKNSSNFPACIGEKDDELVHWCHGSPGVIHLLVLAYRTFGESNYLQIASMAADDIWERGLLKKGI